MSNNILTIQEQKTLPLEPKSKERSDLLALLNNDNYEPFNPNQLLGLDWNNRSQTTLKAKYFIGLKWVKEGESAIYVKPKIPNIDFMLMFMHCFDNECQDVTTKLEKIYNIDFDKEPIKVASDCIELTPMLIVHFLKLAQGIIQKGLKQNYTQREENLSNKIKGKVLLNQTIKHNYSLGRIDRTVCRYQDYSINCIENRVLKKTLLFVNRFITSNPNISCRQDLKQITAYCLGAMNTVNDEIPLQQIKQLKVNPIYKGYTEALKVAKLILRRFS